MSDDDYIILESSWPGGLQDLINIKLKTGMIPVGPMIAHDDFEARTNEYLQVMVSESLHAKMNFGIGNSCMPEFIDEDDLPGERPLI